MWVPSARSATAASGSTSARSYLDLLAAGAFGPLSAAALQSVHRAAVATARAQTLAASASGPAVAMGAWGRVDLGPLLVEVLEAIAGEIEASGAVVSVGVLPAVRGEREPLYRIFANLIENAIKFTQPGSTPRIALSSEYDGRRTVIEVRDQGIGIPEAEREHVFEPMMRGNAASDLPGAGLGLATVRRLVRALDGEVWVAAHPATGACIHLALPPA